MPAKRKRAANPLPTASSASAPPGKRIKAKLEQRTPNEANRRAQGVEQAAAAGTTEPDAHADPEPAQDPPILPSDPVHRPKHALAPNLPKHVRAESYVAPSGIAHLEALHSLLPQPRGPPGRDAATALRALIRHLAPAPDGSPEPPVAPPGTSTAQHGSKLDAGSSNPTTPLQPSEARMLKQVLAALQRDLNSSQIPLDSTTTTTTTTTSKSRTVSTRDRIGPLLTQAEQGKAPTIASIRQAVTDAYPSATTKDNRALLRVLDQLLGTLCQKSEPEPNAELSSTTTTTTTPTTHPAEQQDQTDGQADRIDHPLLLALAAGDATHTDPTSTSDLPRTFALHLGLAPEAAKLNRNQSVLFSSQARLPPQTLRQLDPGPASVVQVHRFTPPSNCQPGPPPTLGQRLSSVADVLSSYGKQPPQLSLDNVDRYTVPEGKKERGPEPLYYGAYDSFLPSYQSDLASITATTEYLTRQAKLDSRRLALRRQWSLPVATAALAPPPAPPNPAPAPAPAPTPSSEEVRSSNGHPNDPILSDQEPALSSPVALPPALPDLSAFDDGSDGSETPLAPLSNLDSLVQHAMQRATITAQAIKLGKSQAETSYQLEQLQEWQLARLRAMQAVLETPVVGNGEVASVVADPRTETKLAQARRMAAHQVGLEPLLHERQVAQQVAAQLVALVGRRPRAELELELESQGQGQAEADDETERTESESGNCPSVVSNVRNYLSTSAILEAQLDHQSHHHPGALEDQDFQGVLPPDSFRSMVGPSLPGLPTSFPPVRPTPLPGRPAGPPVGAWGSPIPSGVHLPAGRASIPTPNQR